MHPQQIWKLIPFFSLIFLTQACTSTDAPDAPDVSSLEVPLEVRRFEQDLFRLDTNNIAGGLALLDTAYGDFAQLYFGEILGANDPRIAPAGSADYIKGFITHPQIRKLYDTTQVFYADFRPWEKQFQQAFRYLKYYFPERTTPRLTTFISEYSIGNFIFGDDELAIGLDFFLGADYPYLEYNPSNANFSSYLTRTFNQEHLVAKTLIPLVQDLAGPPMGNGRLLDLMMQEGKRLYILDHLLPASPDTIIMEVSAPQWDWLQANEQQIWAFFLQEDLFYNSDWQKIRKFVEYSPNSPGMPEEAPGRTASYLGWQIVEAYMKKFPETTLAELAAITDAQELLNKSLYKPRKR